MLTKKQLAITISKLEDFKEYNVKLEQYSTPSEICADMLWNAYLLGDIQGKVIADLASGPGFLGIGALLLGAKKVYFVDLDEEAIEISKRNIRNLKLKNAVFINKNVQDFNEKVDVVIQNPPFGTKQKHHDKIFLEKAFSLSPVVYSFHKANTKKFVEAISKDFSFGTTHYFEYDFALKKTQKFHRKPAMKIKVGCWRLKSHKNS